MSRRYHFIGIGGIGMGALASLLLAKGMRVSGSDLRENAMTLRLREEGAKIFLGHDAQNIGQADCVVYSSAIGEHNLELKSARERKIPVMQRAELLAELMKDYKGITIAGAHGKTTTTSMIAKMLTDAGLQPTTAVGGILNGGTVNSGWGKGNFFVAEVDESDGSFLRFSPTYSVVTNIDREHLDYFKSWENLLEDYQEFLDKTQPGGVIVFNAEDPHLQNLVKKSHHHMKSFGFSSSYDISARNIRLGEFSSSFDCVIKGKGSCPVQLSVPGKHNILNAMACINIGFILNIPLETIFESLLGFKGVQRRFQRKGEVNQIRVIDDYGHHPTEIMATLEAARHVQKSRLVVIFQPHRYTRVQHLWKEFIQSLNACDYLIVTDIYAASEAPIEGITAERLASAIQAKHPGEVIYLKKGNIIPHLLKILGAGDMVLTLGAGDITYLGEELIHQLKQPSEKHPMKVEKNLL